MLKSRYSHNQNYSNQAVFDIAVIVTTMYSRLTVFTMAIISALQIRRKTVVNMLLCQHH